MITTHGQKVLDAEFAKLRRETLDAVLIDHEGNRTAATVNVDRIPDGEHAGEPVQIFHHSLTPVTAVELDGRRFEWRKVGRNGYWTDQSEATP